MENTKYILYSHENNVICIIDNPLDHELILAEVTKLYNITNTSVKHVLPEDGGKTTYIVIEGTEYDRVCNWSVVLRETYQATEPGEYNPSAKDNDSRTHAAIIGIDWKLLREQKTHLFETVNSTFDLNDIFPIYQEAIEGIIVLLDSLQDAVVEDGLFTQEEVFGAEGSLSIEPVCDGTVQVQSAIEDGENPAYAISVNTYGVTVIEVDMNEVRKENKKTHYSFGYLKVTHLLTTVCNQEGKEQIKLPSNRCIIQAGEETVKRENQPESKKETKIMSRDQAYAAMQEGYKITHQYFTKEEYYHIDNGRILDEGGINHTSVFYDDSGTSAWRANGWYVYNDK